MIGSRSVCEGSQRRCCRARSVRRAPATATVGARPAARSGALAVLAGALALTLACYRPAHVECSLRCGVGPERDCPTGTACLADGYCHRPNTGLCAADAAGGSGDGAPPAGRDAGDGASSGGGTDAAAAAGDAPAGPGLDGRAGDGSPGGPPFDGPG